MKRPNLPIVFIRKNFFPVITLNKFDNYWSRLTIGFWFPNCLCSINIILRLISVSILVSITSKAKTFVSSSLLPDIPCINRQFLLKYCSCLSISAVMLLAFPLRKSLLLLSLLQFFPFPVYHFQIHQTY